MKQIAKKSFFIAGTDTGVGKTEVSLGLMESFKRRDYCVAGMKPIACGGMESSQGLENEDASRILAAISADFWRREAWCATPRRYEIVNPYMFKLPIAPHIAAEKENVNINIASIERQLRKIESNAEVTIVEGVGGWQVPISQQSTMQDLVKVLNIPIILTVGLKLGALNHSLLTYQAIKNAGLHCCAWVANTLDSEMSCVTENIQAINQRFDCPCLGVIPDLALPISSQLLADFLDVDILLSM
ncbi:Dethiobiotin synthetase [hydrothermal vent metagenome]|uniref:Dethiobiotin synthetase n=1 Tax=hydrothermal vent metagenome TaxID=652676 RepID=A0A3B0ZIX5_9ZZZZ